MNSRAEGNNLRKEVTWKNLGTQPPMLRLELWRVYLWPIFSSLKITTEESKITPNNCSIRIKVKSGDKEKIFNISNNSHFKIDHKAVVDISGFFLPLIMSCFSCPQLQHKLIRVPRLWSGPNFHPCIGSINAEKLYYVDSFHFPFSFTVEHDSMKH